MECKRMRVLRVESSVRTARLAVSCMLAVGCGVAPSDIDRGLGSDEPRTGAVESAATARYDWLQYNGNAQHGGNNTLVTTLGRTNVASLTRKFQVTLSAVADGVPVYLASVTTSSGVRDLVFVTTKDGRIIALDGQTGATFWSKQFGPGTCHVNNGSSVCFTTSSPAIDAGRGFVYSYGLEGNVHKFAVANGTETTGGGWPQVSRLKGFDDKGSVDSPSKTASEIDSASKDLTNVARECHSESSANLS